MTELIDNQQLDRLTEAVRQLDGAVESLILNDTAILEGLAQMLGAVHQMQMRGEDNQRQLSEQLHQFGLLMESHIGSRDRQQAIIVSDTDAYTRENPETGLLQHLYSFLSNSNAIDVGAHRGDVTERLLRSGYSVTSFEPYPPSFKELDKKREGSSSLRTFPLAIGPHDGTMDFHIVSDVSGKNRSDPTLFNTLVEHPVGHDFRFTQTVPAQVRSLESLIHSGEIPAQVGLLKIDTEGYDLEVIRGMGSMHPSLVMAEFWDSEHAFGKSGKGRLGDLVAEMKGRGYLWHLVIYHLDQKSTISYYHNRSDTFPDSWGNVLFFAEQRLLIEALRWVEDVLPPTLFR